MTKGKKAAKICSLVNQKGGVGKSTITSLIANYIHFNTDYKVCVIDADNKQRTLEKVRKKDIELFGKDDANLYDILSVDSSNIKEIIESLIFEYDYIFIDLPGNILQKGVIECFFLVEYAFFPTNITFADISSLVDFLNLYKKDIVEKRKKIKLDTHLCGILSKVNPQQIEVKQFINNKEQQIIPFMKNYIPYTVNLQRNITTAEEYSSNTYDFEEFCKEFINITITKN